MIRFLFYLLMLSIIFLLAFVVLPSFPWVRNILASPLVISDENARGDVCYVLADGGAMGERLNAAADLVNMGRVQRIIILKDNMRGPYNFKSKTSWSMTQWAVDYLAWRGVPGSRVQTVEKTGGLLGTLQEARNIAAHLPVNVRRLVVVSSAPHMRRAVLAFKRSLPSSVTVVPYAATSFVISYEMYNPIWLEYIKLLVYYVVA
jgi:uncharacterized SAM-binding protein YcdF (DUF218 family)